MADILDDEHVVSPELWRVWQAKIRKHDQANARRFRMAAGIGIGLLALTVVCYLAVAR